MKKKNNKKVRPATRKESMKLDITDERNIARYHKEIDGVFNGSLFIRKKVLLGKPPKILTKYGIEKPLYCSQKVVRKIAYPKGYFGGKHNLGISVLKKLPHELNNPLAITKNTRNHMVDGDSVVVWTNWKNDDNNSVITVIRIENNNGVIMANIVVTVFASGKNYLDQLFGNMKNVLYTKGNKSIKKLLPYRCLMPKVYADDTLIKSVSLRESIIEDKKT